MTKTTSVELRELLADSQVPALPQSAVRLIELSQDPENGPNEFSLPIEGDPGLMGQVLKFVNSSYFGFSREISSIRLAINLVGIRTIRNFALWNAVFSLLPHPQCGPFDLQFLWQDSLRRALFARALGKKLQVEDAEELFSAALLQDLAVPLLARALPEQYESMLNDREEATCRLSDLEQERFGWTHADVAAVVAEIWSFPERFCELVQRHARVDVWAEERDAGVLVTNLSSMLPSTYDQTWSELPAFLDGFCRLTGGDRVMAGRLLQTVDQEYESFAPILNLPIPTQSLSQRLDHQVAVAS